METKAIGNDHRAARVMGVVDVTTCGEDLAWNCAQAIAKAPSDCTGCADYHIVAVLKRLAGKTVWEKGAREALIQTIRPIFEELDKRDGERTDVVIAACADTAVLSTCAHSAALGDSSALARTRFTALDLCPTPLALCEEYGRRHGLEVHSELVDLLATTRSFPADIIVLHNFLPFVREGQQADLLRKLGRWLKPGGRLVIWNPVLAPDDHPANHSTEKGRHADLRALIEEGRIAIDGPKEALFATLDRNVAEQRPGERSFPDVDSLPRLVTSAGLSVQSVTEMPHVRGWRSRLYLMLVAGPAEAEG